MIDIDSQHTKNKILVLSHSGDIGGAELAMLDTLDRLVSKLGVRPVIIIPRQGDLCIELNKRAWKYVEIPYSVWAWPKLPQTTEDEFREYTINSKAIMDIGKLIDKVMPVAVITNTIIAPWAALATGMRKIPHIWHIHEFGDLDHGLIFEQGIEKTLSDVGLLSDLVIVNSRAVNERVQQHVDPTKIQVSYIPYDINEVQVKAKQKAINTPFTDDADIKVVIVGRITPSKGQLEAVKAIGEVIKKRINAQLCIIGAVGDEKYSDEIKRYIEVQGLESNITLENYIHNPYPVIKQADVGVTCSVLEAYGRTTYEYALLGKPVVGTNTGGTPEIIKDGESGFLYRKGDVHQLAKYIEIYAKDKSLIKKHGSMAKVHAAHMQNGEYGLEVLSSRVKAIIDAGKVSQKMPYYTERVFRFSETAVKFKNICEDNLMTRIRELEYILGKARTPLARRVAGKAYRGGKAVYRKVRSK